jgi:hypothetical protein
MCLRKESVQFITIASYEVVRADGQKIASKSLRSSKRVSTITLSSPRGAAYSSISSSTNVNRRPKLPPAWRAILTPLSGRFERSSVMSRMVVWQCGASRERARPQVAPYGKLTDRNMRHSIVQMVEEIASHRLKR